MNRFRVVTLLLICMIAAALPGQSAADKASKEADASIQLKQAKAAALQVKDDFERQMLLGEIGALEARLHQYDDALYSMRLAYPQSTRTLTALGRELATDPQSLKHVSSLMNSDESSTVFYEVAVAQAEEGEIDEALQTAHRIPAPEVRCQALRQIAQRQGAKGDEAGLRNSLALANATYPAEKSSDDFEFATIAAGQLTRGDKDAYRRSIKKIKSPEERVAFLMEAAEKLRKAGDEATARAWFHDGLAELPKSDGAAFIRYMSLPLQVELGELDAALSFASSQTSEMKTNALAAIAVTCAERKDERGVNLAVAQIKQVKSTSRHDLEEFGAQLELLNISAALIDHDLLASAAGLLDYVWAKMDDTSRINLERTIQLQRVVIAVKRNDFNAARRMATDMKIDVVSDRYRANAFRMIATSEANTRDRAVTQPWAAALEAPVDRAYAFLGITQALPEIHEVSLPYSALSIH